MKTIVKKKKRRLSKRGIMTIMVFFFSIFTLAFFKGSTITCKDNHFMISIRSLNFKTSEVVSTLKVQAEQKIAEERKKAELEELKRQEEEKKKQLEEEKMEKENQEDIELLARLVHAEARGNGTEAMAACGAVVINRMNSPLFKGDTLEEIIYAPNQFAVVDDGQINLTPNENAYKAAKMALSGYDPTNGSLYFTDDSIRLNSSYATPSISIDGMQFYYSTKQ